MNVESFPILLNDEDKLSSCINALIVSGGLSTRKPSHLEAAFLFFKEQALTLSVTINNKKLTLSLDFSHGKSKHRRLYGGGKKQPLSKSCGIDKHPNWNILDATAGLGKDAFVLASLGANVTLCEQSTALYALLTDAFYRASLDDEATAIVHRMTCINQNSIAYLSSLDINSAPDVIYLDPMYPERKKTAKIKKEMQILQQLVGHSFDDVGLLSKSLETAKQRVVVKRPKSAAPLSHDKPSYTVSSINTRYDVYVL